MIQKKEKSLDDLAILGSLPSSSVDSDLRTDNSIHLIHMQEEVQNKFAPKKRYSQTLAQIYSRLDLGSRSARVDNCGSMLEFHIYEDGAKLHYANFCKDRLCPMCNWRRSLKIFSQVSDCMNILQSQNYRFLFLTLTIKNVSAEDLPGAVDHMLNGWYTLQKNKIFKDRVLGSFRTLEITRNAEDGTFHPHLHVILVVDYTYFHDKYLKTKEWVDLWMECAELDYKPIVDIRSIKSGPNGLSKAVAEVSKYAVKGSDYLSSNFDTMTESVSALLSALTRRRLCAFCGVFEKARKQLQMDDIENGDLVHLSSDLREDVALMIVKYHWKGGIYYNEIL